MTTKLQNRKQNGFTIIEVLIVLAIAGLIMLIVFLAVPALQRNARNTTIKNDVQIALGAVSDFEGANGGQSPTGCVEDATEKGKWTMTAPNLNSVEFKIKSGTIVTCTSGTTPDITTLTKASTGRINVAMKWGCTSSNIVGTTKPRGVAAVFLTETGSGDTAVAKQCAAS